MQTLVSILKKIFDDQNWTPELLAEAETSYSFQKQLTEELDSKHDDFDEITLLKIVLWKTNRYPQLKPDTISLLNRLRNSYSDQSAREVLLHLLELKGFDLPMASTVLRFACPNNLQIIDKRVYRLIMPENEFKIPYSHTKKADLYFDYLEKLKIIAARCNIPFNRSDRILYQLDKKLNSEVPINY